jgi:hypothetical protein
VTLQQWRDDLKWRGCCPLNSASGNLPHRIEVLDALRRGIYVPRLVRAEYPEFEKRYPELFVRYRREKEKARQSALPERRHQPSFTGPRQGTALLPEFKVAGARTVR